MKTSIIYIFLLILLLITSSCSISSYNETADGNTDVQEVPEANNYQGLRFETLNLDKKTSLTKSPRILCLGDSVTFGWNLPYSESYPMILQEKLKEAYPGAIVINSGIGGNTILDARARLRRCSGICS